MKKMMSAVCAAMMSLSVAQAKQPLRQAQGKPKMVINYGDDDHSSLHKHPLRDS